MLTVSEALKSYDKDRQLEAQNKQLKEYNERLEHRVTERTNELNKQNEKLEFAHHQIVSSINYACNIQQAVLPDKKYISSLLKDYFILFAPKDIVSGDFYWFKKLDNKVLFAIGDCTGHGVPGAFMTLLGIAFLNEISGEMVQHEACHIFESLQTKMKNTFHSNHNRIINESMEICVCLLDTKTHQFQFAGTSSSYLFIVPQNADKIVGQLDEHKVYEIENKKLIQVRCKKNVGEGEKNESPYFQKEIQLEPNDMIYIFSDGYIDQIGGDDLRRYMRARFAETILQNSCLPLDAQHFALTKEFTDWKGANTQTDDVLVFGLKITDDLN